MFKIGDFAEVRDNLDNTLVARGIVINTTNNPKGISFDNKVFYKINSKNLHLIPIFKLKELNSFQIKDFSKYIVYTHNNIEEFWDFDIFMWNDIEPEVKKTVELLNELGFIKTYSSCCGHGKIPAYIDFYILNYEKFFDFIDILNKCGLRSYCFKRGDLDNEYKFRFIIGVEEKNTCHLELVDINSNFDKLNSFLEKYIILNENGKY